MAVIQISKIQVRRGLEENLPQLASGELGWSIDTQRLWIGNGTLTEGAPEIGNTEIVTAGKDILSVIRSYTFQGRESGYTSLTGPNALSDVQRYFQDKLDEQISVRDFGAVGDGATDDTQSIQRAIDQVFPKDYYTTVGVRRRLHFPAGVYITTANLVVPPYASIVGDGPRSTIIKQTYTSNPVVRLKDSKGNVGININTVTSDAPFQLTFKDLTFQTALDNDIFEIDSAQIVTFDGVRFQGNVTAPATAGNVKSAVTVLSSATESKNITFNRCEFARINYGINLKGNIEAISLNQCWFDTLYRGINSQAVVGSRSPQGIKVTSSLFDNIAAEAIYSANTSSVTSAFNYFANVGTTDGGNVVSSTAAYPVLAWNTANNYSLGDVFERSTAQQLNSRLINILSAGQTSTLTAATTQGTVQDTPGFAITLLDNTTANSTLAITTTSSAIIDYSIARSTNIRTGTLRVTHYQGTSVVYDDEYAETANIGVVLSFVGNTSANSAVLQYATSSTGSNATLKYTIRSFV